MDVFLTSYPKSGNTWVRFLFGNLLFPDVEVDFVSIEKLVPDIYKNTAEELKINYPINVFKSHSSFTTDYRNVIYVVRNPLSVCVSLYHHTLKYRLFDDPLPFDEFVNRFVNGEVFPRFLSWQDNVMSWLDNARRIDKFLLLKYEDIHDKPVESLKKVCTFFGLEKNEDDLRVAIEKSSFERMREMEKKNFYDAKIFKAKDGSILSREEIYFVRSGQKDEYRNVFEDKLKQLVYSKFGRAIRILEYEYSFQ